MPHFLSHDSSKRFQKTYRKLSDVLQKQVDAAVLRLIENPAHPGLNVHAIRESRYYSEAYINRGDRLIFRAEGRHLFLIDIVPHDDIGRYSDAPRRR